MPRLLRYLACPLVLTLLIGWWTVTPRLVTSQAAQPTHPPLTPPITQEIAVRHRAAAPHLVRLVRHFPGHSRRFYVKLHRYLYLRHYLEVLAAMHAWFEAISFPPMHLRGVIACIKDAESGNYAESSHPSAGSGAYQYIPSTWRNWSTAAGYGGTSYAYQASPYVQDHVLVYTLTHGGAHNWDPAFGPDTCTVGMP